MDFLSGLKTPCFLYDLDLLEDTLASATHHAAGHGIAILYAIKANHQPTVLRSILQHGLGIDCVSGNEVSAALAHGFPASSIVFAGVGKTDGEINLALDHDILCLNCESVEELQVVAGLAQQRRRVARVALRVNPDVNAETHRLITTGLDENKFGINLRDLPGALEFCKASDHLDFVGLHFHIGSQITNQKPFVELCRKVNQIWHTFKPEHYGGSIVNLGGGLGIDYQDPVNNPMPDFRTYFDIFARHLEVPSHIKVYVELGRSLVGQSASLITKVLYVKKGISKQFAITDAGITDLLRPALYQAVHKIDNLTSDLPAEQYDIVGPACESSDTFANDLLLPKINRGDLLAIRSCGAYAQSMSLHYNLRSKATAYYLRNQQILSEEPPSELF